MFLWTQKKRSFDSPAGNFPPNVQKLFIRGTKNSKSLENFLTQNVPSSGHAEYSFYNPAEELLLKLQKFIAESPKKF